MLRKFVQKLNDKLNPPLHDPLARPLIAAFSKNGIKIPISIVGSPPLSMHVTGSDTSNELNITLTYRTPDLGWWEGVAVGADPMEPKINLPLGPEHKSAGEESAEEKADDIRAWLDEADPIPRRLGGDKPIKDDTKIEIQVQTPVDVDPEQLLTELIWNHKKNDGRY